MAWPGASFCAADVACPARSEWPEKSSAMASPSALVMPSASAPVVGVRYVKLRLDFAGKGIGHDDVGFISRYVLSRCPVDDAVGVLAVVLGEGDFIAGRARRDVKQLRLRTV